jgi:hypothetical protein
MRAAQRLLQIGILPIRGGVQVLLLAGHVTGEALGRGLESCSKVKKGPRVP